MASVWYRLLQLGRAIRAPRPPRYNAFISRRALLLLAINVFGREAASTERLPEVLLVAVGPQLSLAKRMEVELGALHLTTEIRTRERLSSTEILTLAQTSRSLAGIVIGTDADRLRVWIARGDDVQWEELPIDTSDSEGNIALRIAEHLRARLLDLSYAATEPWDSPTQTTLIKAPRRVSLGICGGGVFGPGGLDIAGRLSLIGGFRILPWLRLDVVVSGPMGAASLEGEEGNAKVYASFTGLGASWLPLDASRTIQPWVGLGAGLSLLYMSGTAKAPYKSLTDWVPSALLHGNAGLTIRILPWLQIRGQVLVGVALPRPVVVFGDREVASWGRPMISISSGLEVLW